MTVIMVATLIHMLSGLSPLRLSQGTCDNHAHFLEETEARQDVTTRSPNYSGRSGEKAGVTQEVPGISLEVQAGLPGQWGCCAMGVS